MSIATRRLIARISITVDMCALVALVIGAGIDSRPDWPRAFTAIAFCLVSIGCGLAYLRSSRGRS